ncbi:hypothetical protein HPB49_025622 [Dermacentor silvarum]|uniref:Uncharacterized protein n=1 Tax=Dermacentor silvarum TaxID=543639 RepID=A0ACB8DSB5_DERSI|nr:hypothetical protein HPB49_025622 [Dermacentor silvarum]
MDNVPYHSVKQVKVLHMSSLTKDIQAWLFRKSVAWSSDMVKVELMKLVNNMNIDGAGYCVDYIAEAAGHVVVCLPHYHTTILQSLFGVTSRASWQVQKMWSLWFGKASCK